MQAGRTPELVGEVRGIAHGSRFTPAEVVTLNASVDLQLSGERMQCAMPSDCWSAAVDAILQHVTPESSVLINASSFAANLPAMAPDEWDAESAQIVQRVRAHSKQ